MVRDRDGDIERQRDREMGKGEIPQRSSEEC